MKVELSRNELEILAAWGSAAEALYMQSDGVSWDQTETELRQKLGRLIDEISARGDE
jgi:hypothetical protein